MNFYSRFARGLLVCTLVVVVVKKSPVRDYVRSALSLDDSKTLLYSKQSPFQDENFLSEVSEDASVEINAEQDVVTDEKFTVLVKKGDTLSSLWRDIKGAPKALHSFVKAFTKKQPHIRAGEKLTITRRAEEVVEVRRDLGEGATLIVTGGFEEGYARTIKQAKISTRQRNVSGTIFSSLVHSARNLDLPYSVVDDLVDLFGSRVEFRKDLRAGDTFTVLYDERALEDGTVISSGPIKAASILIQGDLYAVVRDIAKDGTVRYFDEQGEMPTSAFLRYPVKFTRVSSVFSKSRFHPVLRRSRPHNGIDFAAPTGTPVRTVGDGKVIFSGYKKSTGYMVRVRHNARYTTEYMHLSKISSSARVGAKVSRGMVIGKVGSTGLASGPHLHYGMFDKGRYIDPMKAKVIRSGPTIKAPKSVHIILAKIRKEHRSISVAASSTRDSKKAA